MVLCDSEISSEVVDYEGTRLVRVRMQDLESARGLMKAKKEKQLFKARDMVSAVTVRVKHSGFPRALENWKNWGAFSSEGKVGEFCPKTLEKYGK